MESNKFDIITNPLVNIYNYNKQRKIMMEIYYFKMN